jgi:RHS repeat-associated protein
MVVKTAASQVESLKGDPNSPEGLMKNFAGILIAVFALGTSAALSQDDRDQPRGGMTAIPPIDQVIGIAGVDFLSGRYNATSPSISIGDPAQGGLSYAHVHYHDGTQHTVAGGISIVNNTVNVTVSGSTEAFDVLPSVEFDPKVDRGNTLTYNGVDEYIYVFSDGSEARFTKGYIGNADVQGFDEAYLTELRRPNGEVINYHYASQGASYMMDQGNSSSEITYLRLQSITNNFGYQIHFEYELDSLDNSYLSRDLRREAASEYTKIKRVTAFNASVDSCLPLAHSCNFSQDWPHLNISRPSDTERIYADNLGNETRWIFDEYNRIIAVYGPNLADAPIEISYADGSVSQIQVGSLIWGYNRVGAEFEDSRGYNLSVIETTVTHPSGQDTRAIVNTDNNRVVMSEDALGNKTHFEYDIYGRLRVRINPEGDEVRYTYVHRSNLREIRRVAKPGSGLPDLVATFDYPVSCTNRVTCNRPISTTNEYGGTTTYTYDPNHGGVLTVTQSHPSGSGAGLVTQTEYNSFSARYYQNGVMADAPQSVTLPERTTACRTGALPGCASTSEAQISEMRYQNSASGHNLLMVATEQRLGDNSEVLVSDLQYDVFGNVTRVNGPVAGVQDTAFTHYDALRRPVIQIGADPDGSGPLPRPAVRLLYDDVGRVHEQISGTTTSVANWETSFVSFERQTLSYDALGRPVEARSIDSAGTVQAVFQYSYDSAGRLECTAQRVNPDAFGSTLPSACTPGVGGLLGPDQVRRNQYDANGRVQNVLDGLGHALVRYDFTNNGALESLTDGHGNITRYSYDGFDRQERIDYAYGTPEAEFESFVYNAVGRLQSRTNRAGDVFSYGYDGLGRVNFVDAPSTGDDVSYGYDAFGQIETISSAGRTITNTYNALGWLTSQTGPNGTVSYGYDAAGRRDQMSWPDGFAIAYDYDNASRLTHIREAGQTSGLGVLASYVYDNRGRLDAIQRGNGVTTGFAYDELSRLTQMASDMAGSSDDRTLGFSYTPAGQLSERTDSNSAYAFSQTSNQTTSYHHNALNQITSVVETGAVTRTLTPQWTDGNLTSDGIRQFGYDPFNRLNLVTGGGQSDVGLDYDPLGRLFEVDVTGGALTRFQYDGAALIAEYDQNGDMVRRYVHGLGMDAPLVRYDYAASGALEGRRWLLADERGSIYAHADEAGAIIQINTYDEYGRPGNSNQGRFGYTGQVWLAEADLYHYKARAYHAELGVFMQADPIRHSGGINLYAYVGGDPVNATDPWGLMGCRTGIDGEMVEAPCPNTGGGVPWWMRGWDRDIGDMDRREDGLGGGGSSWSCSGAVNNDKCTVTASRTKNWPWGGYPRELMGTVFHFYVNDINSYNTFRRDYRVEFDLAVQILGQIEYESTDQAHGALQEFHNLVSEEGMREALGWAIGAAGCGVDCNLWASGYPRLSAALTLYSLIDILQGLDNAYQMGMFWRHGPAYLDTDLSCELTGQPIIPQHTYRYGSFRC